MEGFDGFIKFDVEPQDGAPLSEDDRYVSDFLYLNGIIAGSISQGPPILMFQRRFRSTIVSAAFPQADTASVINQGAVAFGVYDCNGKPVNDARVELSLQGQPVPQALPFRLPASRIPEAQNPEQPLYTQASGSAGFLNVPPGFVVVTAYRRDETRIGQVQLGSVGGQLTIGTVRPDYMRKADITAATPLAMDGAGGMAGTDR
ncbi:MAG TPA: hypothetical protein VFS67_06215 [Polyangiaceae bacterium]|nr:hypothetical protein [Polyangiaceae bacterium]